MDQEIFFVGLLGLIAIGNWLYWAFNSYDDNSIDPFREDFLNILHVLGIPQVNELYVHSSSFIRIDPNLRPLIFKQYYQFTQKLKMSSEFVCPSFPEDQSEYKLDSLFLKSMTCLILHKESSYAMASCMFLYLAFLISSPLPCCTTFKSHGDFVVLSNGMTLEEFIQLPFWFSVGIRKHLSSTSEFQFIQKYIQNHVERIEKDLDLYKKEQIIPLNVFLQQTMHKIFSAGKAESSDDTDWFIVE